MKLYFHTFGCRVNQYETETLRERMLSGPEDREVEAFEDADLCVVNTCTVTTEADKDALRLIRRISRRNPAARLVVTGCLATAAPEKILEAAPAATVVGNEGKDAIPALLGCAPVPDYAGITSFHNHSRAFVKIQDGCNMHCTYCIIPRIRPTLSCKPYPALEAEVRGLIERGTREIVLCGVRLGRYLVRDNGERISFTGMLERLLAIDGDFRIRLSSLEITDLTDRLLDLLVRSEGKFCPSFHLPLQAGTDEILKAMERWYSRDYYARRVEALRRAAPDAGLFSDIMVGFPGETDALYEEGFEFIKSLGYSGLHVFRYSRRDGTPAARFQEQVAEGVLVARARRMQALDARLRAAFAAGEIGHTRRVLVERRAGGLEGLTENFLRFKFDPAGLPPAEGSLVTVSIFGADGPLALGRCETDQFAGPKRA
ncbi:MAG: tRNA (N(6)-L-threonylcarbamoyladenosine(37)-C(2))-methylthiotransferase MtaB [Elusimicrobia bacterium]|nr:tRNA (N(6)-L-threonylcarbamoyladenosine(37)-C(2))-methylthiotransferase MtaB [Elusimicrobiota bacterium]